MLGTVLKQLLQGAVLLLAAMAFFLLPIGRKTPAQHLRDIVSTPPAQEAAQAFADVARRLAERAVAEVERARARSVPGAEARPAPGAEARPASGSEARKTPVEERSP